MDDNPAITVAEIKAKCRRLGDELGLIVIDYLQLMHVGGRHMDNRVQEVAEISAFAENYGEGTQCSGRVSVAAVACVRAALG